ncbi:TPA: restriction endonuclease subunit S [Enterobacter hormaechei subsp. hoffmannii]|uniref:Restriction endonuclease subunit S n=22 Tax=Pseudomonadota TaxID=1224 RepID=A0A7T0GYA8_9ENTR|nr:MULTISPECIES: restriction endonuclease subunit S [Enterobacteriaceae]ASB73635.1 restriction endonuclease subunit S [Enterobacter cloacae complex sp.]EBU3151298.1 restriction endonuclease subunit S [Salmonella enterica]EFJ8057731.1 restriction endonuclease subunit S [Escherichia coli]EKU7608771.1 restriction endonuclease subunit S [Citrobacter freundii]MDU7882110.1 restriction endonuclease subunit S [Klebsiella michiganensis]HDH1863842.1 restriction endonuclease subunit S [Klebsiella quasip
MSEWVVKNLDEVVEYFIDYRGKTPVKTGSGIPLITAKIVKDGCLQTPTEFISVEDYPLWMTRGYPEVNDVVLTTEAPLGEVALIKNKNVALAQRIITLRGYKNILDNKFLKYWLQSEQGQYELESRASGTTVFGIKSSILKKIPISLPPYNEQVAISSVLYSIDEKIDLLHRQNKTLESMAETLFRQWFDVDSNEKWQEKNVLDIFTLVGGGTPKTSVAEYWTDEIPWISGGDISSAHQGYLYRTEKSISLAGLQNSSAKLLPKNSTVISARGTVGKYALLARDMAFSQSNYGIVSKIGSYPFFIYLLVGFIVDDLLAAAYGSVFDTITTRTFESVNLKFPSLNSIEKFNKEVASLFNKKEINTSQIKILEKLRDTLLPKLMSGEVRVRYAEEEISAVA